MSKINRILSSLPAIDTDAPAGEICANIAEIFFPDLPGSTINAIRARVDALKGPQSRKALRLYQDTIEADPNAGDALDTRIADRAGSYANRVSAAMDRVIDAATVGDVPAWARISVSDAGTPRVGQLEIPAVLTIDPGDSDDPIASAWRAIAADIRLIPRGGSCLESSGGRITGVRVSVSEQTRAAFYDASRARGNAIRIPDRVTVPTNKVAPHATARNVPPVIAKTGADDADVQAARNARSAALRDLRDLEKEFVDLFLFGALDIERPARGAPAGGRADTADTAGADAASAFAFD